MQPVLVEILLGFLSTKKCVRRCSWTPEVPQKCFDSSFILMTLLQGMWGLDDFFLSTPVSLTRPHPHLMYILMVEPHFCLRQRRSRYSHSLFYVGISKISVVKHWSPVSELLFHPHWSWQLGRISSAPRAPKMGSRHPYCQCVSAHIP